MVVFMFSPHLKPNISKGHSSTFFLIFHQIFFLAFNSRDNTMLWVLNLFSRSSSTKLWKRIFEKMSQNFFWHSKLASGEIASYWLRGKDQISVRNFDENFFFEKHFYVHWMNAHMFCIIQRLWKTSKNVFPLVVDDPKNVYIAIKNQKNFDKKKFLSKFLTPI